MKTVKLGGVVSEVDRVLRETEAAIAHGDVSDLDKWVSIVCRRLERQLRKRIESGESTPEEAVHRVAEVVSAVQTWFEQFKTDVSEPCADDLPRLKPK
jgi:hypothetical protein